MAQPTETPVPTRDKTARTAKPADPAPVTWRFSDWAMI